jgi:hypothetical protein
MRYGPRNYLAAAPAPSGVPAWDSFSDDAASAFNYAVPMAGLAAIGLLTGGIGDALLGAFAGYLVAPNLPVYVGNEPGNKGPASGPSMTTVLLLGGLLGVAIYASKK